MKSFRYLLLLIIIITGALFNSCKRDFLVKPPQGALSEQVLATGPGVDGLLIGAYAALDGNNLGSSQPWSAAVNNWIFGSVAGGDAHKGSDAGDQAPINTIATFAADPSNPFFSDKWRVLYGGIDRANSVLKVLPKAGTQIADGAKKNIEAQARFIRAHFYFELKRFYNNAPWIDETTVEFRQPNNVDLWPKIEADLKFAYDNLPETQPEAGRVNKWAAAAYLGKVYLYQKKYQEAKTYLELAINSGKTTKGVKYDLFPSIEDNFRPEKELTSPEAVFVVEFAANVGTNTINNATNGEMLNYPYGGDPFTCCGFFQPTQDLVNSYKTDAAGLPMPDTYNQAPVVTNDMRINSTDPFTPYAGTVDPRLDWTVGRRGIPYKDWGIHPGKKWIRDQDFSGPFSPKKNVWWQANKQYYDASSWAPGTAINYSVIRFADVLLMAAEANAQLNLLPEALAQVNRVRTRAGNPADLVYQYVNPATPTAGFTTVPAANYLVSPYPAFASKDAALKAIYFERKLELAMEGHRFFDLVRWGIAESTLNAFFAYEGTITNDIKTGKFTPNKNEVFPVPQGEIDKTTIEGNPTLTQNPNYK